MARFLDDDGVNFIRDEKSCSARCALRLRRFCRLCFRDIALSPLDRRAGATQNSARWITRFLPPRFYRDYSSLPEWIQLFPICPVGLGAGWPSVSLVLSLRVVVVPSLISMLEGYVDTLLRTRLGLHVKVQKTYDRIMVPDREAA